MLDDVPPSPAFKEQQTPLAPSQPSLDEDSVFLSVFNRVLDINSPVPSHSVRVRDRIRKDKQGYRGNVVNHLKIQVLRLKRALRSQQEDSEILKEYTVSVMLEREQVERELSNLRSRYSEDLAQAKSSRLHLQNVQNELAKLERRFSDAERFILALLDLGLEPPVLRGAVSSVLTDGQDGEDALINAVQKASTDADRPVTGPRTSDHYLSALELTINARKELKEKARYAQFWKTVAKSDPANSTIMTPSPSDLDSLNESSVLHRPSVVDDLVYQLRDALAGKPVVGGKSARKAGVADLPSHSHPTSQPLSNRDDVLDPTVPACPLDLAPQPPVAVMPKRSAMKAQPVLREGIVVSSTMQSLAGAARRLSDPNLSLTLLTGGDSPDLRASQTCELPSLRPPLLPPCIASSFPAPLTRSRRQVKRMSFPLVSSPSSASRNKQLNDILTSGADSPAGTLRACQALLSLERICAGFSSSSLASLNTTEDDSDPSATRWFTSTDESTSPSSSANDLTSNTSICTRPLPAGSSFIGHSETRKTHEEAPDGRDTNSIQPHCANDAEVGNENTRSPPATPLINGAPTARKTVKWALPLSPESDRSSTPASIPTTSSSSSVELSASSPSRKVRAIALGKARAGSSSSPSPSPASGRRAGPKVTKSFSKASRVLKPKPSIVFPTSTKLAGPAKPESRVSSPVTTPPRRGQPALDSTEKVKTQLPPSVPPRSPLRSQGSRLALELSPRGSVPGVERPKPSVSQSLEGDRDGTGVDSVVVTTVPQTSSAANMRLYDYTSPVRPLNVVKKNSPRPSNPSKPSSSSSSQSKPLPPTPPNTQKRRSSDLPAKEASSVASPPPRLRSRPSPIEITASAGSTSTQESSNKSENKSFTSSTSSFDQEHPSASTDYSFNDQLRHSDATADTEQSRTDTKPVIKRSSGQSQFITTRSSTARQSAGPATTLKDVHTKSTHVVPPARKSSLVPPRIVTSHAPLRRPQLGPLHPIRPRGAVAPRGSSKPRYPSTTTREATPSEGSPLASATPQITTTMVPQASAHDQLAPTALEGPKEGDPEARSSSSYPVATIQKPPVSGIPTSVPSLGMTSPPMAPGTPPKKGASLVHVHSVGTTSPLARLKLSILPPNSLVRSFSTSQQHMVGAEAALPTCGGPVLGVQGSVQGEKVHNVPVRSYGATGAKQAPNILVQQACARDGARHHGLRKGILGHLSPKKAS